MAAAGADVAVLARNQQLLAEIAAEVSNLGQRAHVAVADVTDPAVLPDAVRQCAEALSGLTCVVTNAGGNNFSSPFTDIRADGFEKAMRLNFDSVISTLQAAATYLEESATQASVINVASVAGIRGAPGMSHYGAAKAAIVSLTKSLALEWADKGIRVNALLPGWIATDLTAFLREEGTLERSVLKQIPMARWGAPSEIAEPAVFLASPAAAYLTGQVLVIDGGLTA